MHPLGRRFGIAVIMGFVLSVMGCASRVAAPVADNGFWMGRLALQVEGSDSQSFSSLFELRGDDRSGELALLSPLGNQIALLAWKDGHAELTSAQGNRSSDSLDALLSDIVGAPLPIAALFDWLNGKPTLVPGWEADLSAASQGRFLARRSFPLPAASLRIALTR